MSTENKPRLPAVGEFVRMHGRLVEIHTPPPVQPPDEYIFEETTARVEAWVNNYRVKEFSTLSDFYGEGTCVEEAIKEAKAKVELLGNDLEIVVIKITSRCRKRPERDENFYDRKFVDFVRLERGWRVGLPDETEEVVWSSKRNIGEGVGDVG